MGGVGGVVRFLLLGGESNERVITKGDLKATEHSNVVSWLESMVAS